MENNYPEMSIELMPVEVVNMINSVTGQETKETKTSWQGWFVGGTVESFCPPNCGSKGGDNVVHIGDEGKQKTVNGVVHRKLPISQDRMNEVLESDKASTFYHASEKWLKDGNADAKEHAYEMAMKNLPLRMALLVNHFKSDWVPETVNLYRVGPADTGQGRVASFWTNRKAAESYQKRMGIHGVDRYSANIMKVVPSGSGAGEVWASMDHVKQHERLKSVSGWTIESFCPPNCGGGQGHVDSQKWKPTMTKQEAKEFVKDSKYTKDVYHVTMGANVASIKKNGFDPERIGSAYGSMWGNGVYVGLSKEDVGQYHGFTSKTMTMKINIRNPYVVESSQQMEKVLKLYKVDERAFKERVSTGEALARTLREKGHDGLIFKTSSKAFGGNQIVVWNPKQAVVVGK